MPQGEAPGFNFFLCKVNGNILIIFFICRQQEKLKLAEHPEMVSIYY